MQQTKNTNRRVGQIRQATSQHLSSPNILKSTQNIPHAIKDLTINNINLYNEMKVIDNNCQDVFEKYQDIIRNLQNVIQNLVDKNAFINSERLRLVTENIALRQELQNIKQNYFVADSRVVKNVAIFDVIPEDDSILPVIPQPNKKRNQVLQQSQFDLCSNNHHFSSQVSADLSLSDAELKSEFRTPCLNRHHTLIQCKSNNNQAPLRVFYLLLLQQQVMIQKLKQLLLLCQQDDTKILLHLLPKNNQLWSKILGQFLNSILQGKFQNQSQVITYIIQNPLIDMLLVSLLKSYLPLENQDQNLNIGDWKNQQIDHRVLFQGLCNQFDLKFQYDNEHLTFRFYPNKNQKSMSQNQNFSSSISQQNLLESKVEMCEQLVQISLFANNNKIGVEFSDSRQQPLFKIWLDPQKKYYRINISIRPSRYHHETQQYQQSSFHRTENNQYSQYKQSRIQSQQLSQKQYKEVYENNRIFLGQMDMNKIKINKSNYVNQSYQKKNNNSKNITGSNSKVCYNLQIQ